MTWNVTANIIILQIAKTYVGLQESPDSRIKRFGLVVVNMDFYVSGGHCKKFLGK
jgi:hypothetical protein